MSDSSPAYVCVVRIDFLPAQRVTSPPSAYPQRFPRHRFPPLPRVQVYYIIIGLAVGEESLNKSKRILAHIMPDTCC